MSRKQKDILNQKYRQLSVTGSTEVSREELERLMVRFRMEGRKVKRIGIDEVKKKTDRVIAGRGKAS